MRPFEIEHDDRFNFMIGGSQIDHPKTASSREELMKTFYEVSGRTDIEFGELLWMGLWRSIYSFLTHSQSLIVWADLTFAWSIGLAKVAFSLLGVGCPKFSLSPN